ncbi:hypothetical protein HQ563_18910, partial [bacterium]|nr:hypothetical protein [bacterium]
KEDSGKESFYGITQSYDDKVSPLAGGGDKPVKNAAAFYFLEKPLHWAASDNYYQKTLSQSTLWMGWRAAVYPR